MSRAAKQHKKKLARKAALKKRGPSISMPEFERLLREGLAHHQAGRMRDAEALYGRLLEADPDNAEGNHLLGVLAHGQGDLGRAEGLMRKAVAARPAYVQAHNNLGNLLRDQGKPAAAADCYRRALALEPGFAMAHCNLGTVLKDQGRLEDAVAAYRRALAADPAYSEAHNNLGLALGGMGRLEDAAAALRRAIALKPDYGEAYNNLGLMLQKQGRTDDAIAAYEQALAHMPGLAQAHNNLAMALQDAGRLADAAAAIGRSLALMPDNAEAHSNRGAVLKNQGRLDEALAAFRRALGIRPDYAEAHSNLIFTMNCHDRVTQAEILAESRRWAAVHGTSQGAPVHDNPRDLQRRLRIGYVSPDFRRHSVSRFLDPVIGGHDRDRFEVFCYAQVAAPDDETRRFQALADHWRSTVGMTDGALAEAVRADGVDILVDLAGHTAGNRLALFARRPAPVQAAWLGYPNTSGLEAMDYRLIDAVTDPPGPGDGRHSETLIRLHGGFLCFTPETGAPAVAAAPAASRGHVTFGSFNSLAKVTPAVVAVWSRILMAVPGSRLLLKNRSLADGETRARYSALFAAHGIAAQRLEFCAWIASPSGHLGAYEGMDIGLDPFPYNGTTTTCEALWMGVPVVTLAGDRHAGRVGASLLHAVGKDDLIADSAEHYVAVATALAEDPSRRQALRETLRPTMAASPLCDAARLTREIEAAYHAMWAPYC